jgi:hypothetical protein
MKAALLAPPATLAVLAVLAAFAPAARADDTVRACIAASTSGQTLRQQGKLLAAREEMIACARDACPPIVRSHCARWLSEVDAAIPSVVVRAQDAGGGDAIGARLSIDGRAGKLDGQPVRLDPGEHTLAVENERGARKKERVLLVEGEPPRLVTLRLPAAGAESPREPAADSARGRRYVPPGAWILGAAGLLTLGAATYLGLAANGDLSTLDSTCSPHCTSAQTQPGRTDAALFDVSLGVGTAAVVAAIVWAVAFPSHASPATSPRLEVRPIAGGALTALTIAY